MAAPMLETKNLGISFGGLKAVDELTMTINKGQLYGLIGPNGAGKTTVFNLLTGVYKPTELFLRWRKAHRTQHNRDQQEGHRENLPEYPAFQAAFGT